jgi:hypothetical protein
MRHRRFARPPRGGSDEDDWRRSLGAKHALQLDSARLWHLHVDNQARCLADMGRLKELVGGRESVGPVAEGP